MDLLRFTTAGSVDDGKSTLIGRLLYDSKAIFDDQYEAIRASSEKRGEDYVNLALLTDGLRAEREQGITIDVAYRYFATPKRKFIVADTPGHIQYTRNMVTGASTANLAILLIDARKGVIEQTCRHAFIASLLGIPHVVACVNKMDLVGWSESVFEEIRHAFDDFTSRLDIKDVHFIPISALLGDNVVDRSREHGLVQRADPAVLAGNGAYRQRREPRRRPLPGGVRHSPPEQRVSRLPGLRGPHRRGRVPGRGGDHRAASGFASRVKSVDTFEGPLEEAFAPMSVTLTLEDEIDISRGDMIVRPDRLPSVSQDIDVMVCWLNEKKLLPNGKYLLKHTTRDVRCLVKAVAHKVNVNTLERIEDDRTVGLNEIARMTLRTTQPLFFDTYSRNRNTGSLILIDEATNETVAAGMIQ